MDGIESLYLWLKEIGLSYPVYSNGLTMLYLVVALMVVRLVLALFDRSLGIEFKKDVWDVVATDPRALADYHGKRFIGVCLVAAAFIL